MAKGKLENKLTATLGEGFMRGDNKEIYWDLGEDNADENDLNNCISLSERINSLEIELAERNKIINKMSKQKDEYTNGIEKKNKKMHEFQIIIKTMEANLHQLEGERRQYLDKIEEYGKEIARLQDKYTLAEEDIKNITGQLKARTQESIILNKENRDLQRTNNQILESNTLLESNVRKLNQHLSQIEPAKINMENKYNRALESLRKEVKAKHQEIMRLNTDLKGVNNSYQSLRRVNENLELELDMLNTMNISLQKKIERLAFQNSNLERKLRNKLVRLVLGISSLFGWSPEGKTKSADL